MQQVTVSSLNLKSIFGTTGLMITTAIGPRESISVKLPSDPDLLVAAQEEERHFYPVIFFKVVILNWDNNQSTFSNQTTFICLNSSQTQGPPLVFYT